MLLLGLLHCLIVSIRSSVFDRHCSIVTVRSSCHSDAEGGGICHAAVLRGFWRSKSPERRACPPVDGRRRPSLHL